MRTLSGEICDTDYVIQQPFRMLISGSSGTGTKLQNKITQVNYFLGKTTFVENLISSNRLSHPFSTIYYCYPFELGDPPVSWHDKTSSAVEYLCDLPDAKFFDQVEEDSLLVLDDLWSETCKSPDLVKAFKVFSRKKGVSIISISQSYFSGGDAGREIRNNW